MANKKQLIEREELFADIEILYQKHYVKSYDKTIHDIFNAVRRRIRRCPTVDAVELPVKIGQKVYTIPRCAIREWTVVGVWLSVREEYSYVHISWSKSGRIMESRSVNFCDIDKTLYLTREEAESALAKMDGDGNA